jgi:aminoacrylate hydrolase
MDMISVGDADLAVWQHAGPDGCKTPVLLVSGLGGRAVFWDPVVPSLTPRFKVITHDHRGTGASTKSKIDYSVAQMARDVLALMDALGVEKAALVGHSTGGAIAQHLALNNADRLSAIVLSATWSGPSVYFKELFDLRLAVLETAGPEAYLTDGILRAYPPDHLNAHAEIITGTKAQRVAAFPGVDIERSRIHAVQSHDLRARSHEIALPTLVIGAADDQITPVAFSEELAAAIPNAQKVILPRGGHFVPHVETRAYNQAVSAFLTSVLNEA